jgi:UPF0716 protein FxsA
VKFILLVLLSLPLLEIGVLVAVGSKIGVLATIGLVILTGMLGTFLLRVQGFSAFARLQNELRSGKAPERELANAAMIMLAGVFLIIPGFISDIIGLLLFLPPVRALVIKAMASRVTVVRPGPFGRDNVVDLDSDEFRRTDDDENENSNGASPWRLPQDRR